MPVSGCRVRFGTAESAASPKGGIHPIQSGRFVHFLRHDALRPGALFARINAISTGPSENSPRRAFSVRFRR